MSGIYIKGIEMPRKCIACPIGFFDNEYDILHCPLTGEEFHSTDFVYKRSENCPLVFVPPHGRLIDEKEVLTGCGYIIADGMACIPVKHIANAPTIIPADKEALDT